MQKTIAATLAASIALAGCATSSANITAGYTAPLQYQAYDCAQLTSEAQRVHGRANQLAGRLDEAASNDKMLTGVGLVLFWPALFALGGTKQQEVDYARLKGEYDAIGQAMIAKKCDQAGLPASVQPPAPQPPTASSPAGASS
jgi:cell division septum initiation protein DivIVA